MGKKDIVTKRYLSDNEKFADIFNYYLYNGRKVILPRMLVDDSPEELFARMFPDGNIFTKGKMRDLLKRCIIKREDKITYILLGAESASDIHYALPVKNGLYDFMDYATQVENISKEHRRKGDLQGAQFLSGFSKSDKIKPVVTLTVYFGTEEWDGPTSLYEMFDIDDVNLLRYVDNYKINLIVPKNIKDSDKFTTDFREVVDFMKVSGNKNDMKKLIDSRREEFANMDPVTAMVLRECANVKIEIDDKEDKTNMCKAIDDMIEDAREEGRQEMCKAIDDMVEDARQEVRQEVKTENIIRIVNILREVGLDRKVAVSKISEEYLLSEKEAADMVEQNW